MVVIKFNLMRVERSSRMKAQHTGNEIVASNHDQQWLELVRRQVESLRFGVVQVVVHDSRTVQIEKTERIRLNVSPGR